MKGKVYQLGVLSKSASPRGEAVPNETDEVIEILVAIDKKAQKDYNKVEKPKGE